MSPPPPPPPPQKKHILGIDIDFFSLHLFGSLEATSTCMCMTMMTKKAALPSSSLCQRKSELSLKLSKCFR